MQGIPVNRMTILLFILTATSAAFVGMCHAILFNSAQVSGGMNDIFNIIVSVVIGGVLLTGGFGSVFGIFIGTLTFAIVNRGIDFTAIDRNWSNLIIGLMLLLAVGMNESFRKLALSAVTGKKTDIQEFAGSGVNRARRPLICRTAGGADHEREEPRHELHQNYGSGRDCIGSGDRRIRAGYRRDRRFHRGWLFQHHPAGRG